MARLWKQYNYVMILIVVILILGFYMIASLQDRSSCREIVVGEGQTLWNIADRYAKAGSMNREEFIRWVEAHNDIDGNMIKAGEKIVIPVEKNGVPGNENEMAFK
nr:LysM peptidoglycan-binding domain-containing protein [Weizmannia acidilactici]